MTIHRHVPYDQLRRQLLHERRDLVERGRIERDTFRLDGAADRDLVIDEAEASANDLHDELEGALMQMRQEAIAHIDRALARIEAGTYGVCVECGDLVGAARLRALPFASRCYGCASAHESARPASSIPASRPVSLPLEAPHDAAA